MGRDFGAEKLARKAAEMPEVDPDIDLAALRAKAQGAKMSDEEKKARGLLYDKSIASAVRDESEEEDEVDAQSDTDLVSLVPPGLTLQRSQTMSSVQSGCFALGGGRVAAQAKPPVQS